MLAVHVWCERSPCCERCCTISISTTDEFGRWCYPASFSVLHLCVFIGNIPFTNVTFQFLRVLLSNVRTEAIQSWKYLLTFICFALEKIGAHVDHRLVPSFTILRRQCLITIAAFCIQCVFMYQLNMKVQLWTLTIWFIALQAMVACSFHLKHRLIKS